MSCNPCFCLQFKTVYKPDPCVDKPECCLKACSAVIVCEDAVPACGQTGAFDLDLLEHVTSGCEGGLTYSLYKHDEFFADVSVSKAGILSWTTKGEETIGKYGEVLFKISCQANCDDCIVLESIGKMTIGVKDLCKGVTCEGSEICNKCTGDCEAPLTNTSASNSLNYTNTYAANASS